MKCLFLSFRRRLIDFSGIRRRSMRKTNVGGIFSPERNICEMKSSFENMTDIPLDGGIENANVSRLPDGEFSELPEGLAMAFAQDTRALARFTSLSV